MMKIANINPRFTPNTIDKFSRFEKEITDRLVKKQNVDSTRFSTDLYTIGKSFAKNNNLKNLNNSGSRLAEKLVNLGKGELAGIVYSFLIKLNPENTTIIEKFATNAIAIAKRFHDPIHIMARAYNLEEIYKVTMK